MLRMLRSALSNVIEELGKYRTDFLTSEDIDLWLRIGERYSMVALNDCSYFVRLHSTSATRRHAANCKFYRELALKYHEERLDIGADPLQRGEPMPQPNDTFITFDDHKRPTTFGKIYRDDLDFIYRLMVNARDWRNIINLARELFASGWRRSATYKLLLFPFLGDRLVQLGVRLKHRLLSS